MVKIALTFLCLLLLPLFVAAQKSVSELPPAHASALQEFLTKHPELQFLSEREMDKETLKDMRKNFGARLTPYYRTGDFNRDGIQDFAMILAKEVSFPKMPSSLEILAFTHTARHTSPASFNPLYAGLSHNSHAQADPPLSARAHLQPIGTGRRKHCFAAAADRLQTHCH